MAAIPLVALLILMGVSLSRLTSDHPAPASFASPERPAPDIQLASLDGGPIRFDTGGDVRLVNFFASWCTPCRAEHPILLQLKEQGVNITGVLYKDETEAGRALLARDGDPFAQVAIDPTGDAGLAFGISGVPETFMVDARGRIIKTFRGPLDASRAREFLDAYRAELAKRAG
jgi:cytochrome c biogenesis protein CcmG, thiol:disulfide interchange protein DsbE